MLSTLRQEFKKMDFLLEMLLLAVKTIKFYLEQDSFSCHHLCDVTEQSAYSNVCRSVFQLTDNML